MSLRQRANVPSTLIDRENVMTRMLKQTTVKQMPARRPALGEVGNKIHAQVRPTHPEPKKAPLTKEITQVQKLTINNKKHTAITTSKVISNNGLVTKKVVKTERSEKTSVQEATSILARFPSRAAIPRRDDLAYSTKQIANILLEDEKDKDDPFLVSEYVQDIYDHLRRLEEKYAIRPEFLLGHKSTHRMRALLINWMVEVHLNFSLMPETFHMSVAIVDRYLQLNPSVGRSTLQLVGTTALFIASKYEEMRIPLLSDFVYVCDDTFTANEILKMEREMLGKLGFNLGRPLSLHFLRRFSKVAAVQPEHHAVAKYLVELALLNYQLCHKRPSLQAAAACCMSIAIWNEVEEPATVWSRKMEVYSSYHFKDIRSTMVEMARTLCSIHKSEHQAISKKYASSSFFKVSTNAKLRGSIVQRLADEAQPLSNAKQ